MSGFGGYGKSAKPEPGSQTVRELARRDKSERARAKRKNEAREVVHIPPGPLRAVDLGPLRMSVTIENADAVTAVRERSAPRESRVSFTSQQPFKLFEASREETRPKTTLKRRRLGPRSGQNRR